MKNGAAILACLIAIASVCYLSSDPNPGEVRARTLSPPAPRGVLLEPQNSQQAIIDETYRRETDQAIEGKRQAELAEGKRQKALLQMEQTRNLIQARARSAYELVARTNSEKFAALVAGGRAGNLDRVTCTICNGSGNLPFCLVCNNKGVCPSCNGAGQVLGDICAACLGKGKCFVCSGSTHMQCVFCDDGIITINHDHLVGGAQHTESVPP
jgi:hypothetical protein